MKNLFAGLVVAALAAGPVAAQEAVITYDTDQSFDDVIFGLENAILDEGLVVENAGLTEWPIPLLGRFDPAFLDVPPEVVGCPTVREASGLALSSRNRYLDETARRQAAALPAAMREAIGKIEDGTPVADALAELEATLLEGGFDRVDYAALADAASLEMIDALSDRPARLLVAAHIQGTRLIDNMAVEPQP